MRSEAFKDFSGLCGEGPRPWGQREAEPVPAGSPWLRLRCRARGLAWDVAVEPGCVPWFGGSPDGSQQCEEGQPGSWLG